MYVRINTVRLSEKPFSEHPHPQLVRIIDALLYVEKIAFSSLIQPIFSII